MDIRGQLVDRSIATLLGLLAGLHWRTPSEGGFPRAQFKKEVGTAVGTCAVHERVIEREVFSGFFLVIVRSSFPEPQSSRDFVDSSSLWHPHCCGAARLLVAVRRR